MPGADYIEEVLKHFDSINPAWLLTGQGELFLHSLPHDQRKQASHHKKTKGNIQANSGQTVNNITLEDCKAELETYKAELEAAQNEIKPLRDQLTRPAAW